MAYGTLSITDLLEARSTSVADFGEQKVYDAIAAYMTAHNAITMDMLGDLVETTTDRQRRVGGVDTMVMEAVDEFGRVDAQKVATVDTVGFPLYMYAIALQWTRKYMQTHTPAEMAVQAQAATTADTRNLQKLVKTAIFSPTNVTGYVDRLVDNVTLAAIKRLQNADSAPIMPGPNGETFDGATHTHYLGAASGTLAETDIDSLVSTVREHFTSGQMRIYINAAQEAAVRGFTGSFDKYVPIGIVQPQTAQYATGTLDVLNVGNRAIGMWDGTAEVWVKPWIPAGYMFCWIAGQDKPVVMRERNAGSGAFGLDYDNEQFPLRAQQFGREVGFGVWTRSNGAVLRTNNATYAAPSL